MFKCLKWYKKLILETCLNEHWRLLWWSKHLQLVFFHNMPLFLVSVCNPLPQFTNTSLWFWPFSITLIIINLTIVHYQRHFSFKELTIINDSDHYQWQINLSMTWTIVNTINYHLWYWIINEIDNYQWHWLLSTCDDSFFISRENPGKNSSSVPLASRKRRLNGAAPRTRPVNRGPVS